MRMNPILREEQRRYQKDLARRTRKVPCSRCGAKAGAKCVGAFGQGTETSCWARHHAAKTAGFIDGRRRIGEP